jgi:hypothetical protein
MTRLSSPSRRSLLLSAGAAALANELFGLQAAAQFSPVLSSPLIITVRRSLNFATALNEADCIFGRLYPDDERVFTGAEALCDTIELPFRNERSEISCIRAGTYRGFVRTEPTAEGVNLGWRVQLIGTKQSAIQIHVGNTLQNTRGCILVGTRSDEPNVCLKKKCIPGTTDYYSEVCALKSSASARGALRTLYGVNNAREIVIHVVDSVT